jgi:hypothetical protein
MRDGLIGSVSWSWMKLCDTGRVRTPRAASRRHSYVVGQGAKGIVDRMRVARAQSRASATRPTRSICLRPTSAPPLSRTAKSSPSPPIRGRFSESPTHSGGKRIRAGRPTENGSPSFPTAQAAKKSGFRMSSAKPRRRSAMPIATRALSSGRPTLNRCSGTAPITSQNLESYGVPPDVWVDNGPADFLAGHDRQVEKAVELLTAEIK